MKEKTINQRAAPIVRSSETEEKIEQDQNFIANKANSTCNHFSPERNTKTRPIKK